MIKEYSKNRIHTWTCSLNYIYIIHYTVYSIHVFYVFSLHESPIVLGYLRFEVLDNLQLLSWKEKVYLFDVVSKVPRFFLQQKQRHMRFFFCEKNGSMDIHSLGFSIGGGFKKQEGSPLFLGRFPFGRAYNFSNGLWINHQLDSQTIKHYRTKNMSDIRKPTGF